MKPVVFVVIFLAAAFFIGFFSVVLSNRPTVNTTSQPPVTREFTLSGDVTVPVGTKTATILGSIAVSGIIPEGSTINVEAKQIGNKEFTTVVQNIPAKANQTFSYTKATGGTNYDMKVTLLDPTSKVIGTSQTITVSAPSLNAQFSVHSEVPSISPTPIPTPMPTGQANITPTPVPATETPTPSPTPTPSSLSGNISFHGAAPINSRIVVLQELANGSPYRVAVDDLVPVDGTLWHWDDSISGNSYSVIAILKQKQSDGNDIDIASSAPVTVTAPRGFIVLTVNSYYTLTKPTANSSVTCTTYNGGPNQNTWNVTVNFPTFTGAQSYWLEIGTTDGGSNIVNTSGSTLAVSAVFNNNTTYYARYAYAAVAGVDTGSGQYSAFSDSTRLSCSK
jgi:hypothetical protein